MSQILQFKSVVLLNSDNTLLSFVSPKRAINLYFSGKVEVKKSKPGRLHPKLDFGYPIIVRIKPEHYRYIHKNKKRTSPKKKRILLRDNYKCGYCDCKLHSHNATVDHVIPKSHANYPGHIWENVISSCMPCNNKKADRTPEQAGMKLLKKPFVPRLEDLIFAIKPDLLEAIKELDSETII